MPFICSDEITDTSDTVLNMDIKSTVRADIYLFSAGHAKSRQEARRLIDEGGVSVDGRLVAKPSEPIDPSIPHTVSVRCGCPYVSRGGLKLAAALDALPISVSGMRALDIGASSGGFTD